MDSLSVQLYAFAVTLIAGASIGLIFDLYRVIRSRLQPGAHRSGYGSYLLAGGGTGTYCLPFGGELG